MSVLESTYRELLLRKKAYPDYSVTGVLMPGATIERFDKSERESYCEIDNSDQCIIVFLCIESENIGFNTFDSNEFLKDLGMSILLANECDKLNTAYTTLMTTTLRHMFINIINAYKPNKLFILDDRLNDISGYEIIDFTKPYKPTTSNDYVLTNLIDMIKTGSKPNLFIADNMKDSAYDLNESIRDLLIRMLYSKEDYLENISNEHLIAIPYFDDCSSLKMRKTSSSSDALYKIGKGIYSMANKDAIVFGSNWRISLYTSIIYYVTHVVGLPTIIIE